MTTLVTGAGGFLGSHLAEKLLEKGEDIVCMIHRRNLLEGIRGFRFISGSVSDKGAVEKAMRGCDRVYHAAAAMNYSENSLEEFIRVNCEGTRNVMEAALEAGVKKVVYTSSVSTIYEKNSGKANEEHHHRSFFENAYAMTKYRGEKIAFEYGARGLNVSVINPALIYGPRESRSVGPLMKNYLERRMRFVAFLDTIFNLVHVRDVADCHIAAMKKGRKGHRYIAGGHNLTIGDFLQMLDEITGTKNSAIKLPNALVEGTITAANPFAKALGIRLPVSKELIRAMKVNMEVDSTKANKELGLKITPLREGLEETINWYRENGYIRI